MSEYESNSNSRIRKDLVKYDMYLSVVGLVGDSGGGNGDSGGEGISRLVVTSSSSFLFFSLQANVFSGDIYKEELLWKCQIRK